MTDVSEKLEQINKVMNSDKDRQTRLLKLEKIYNQALEQGLVSKPLYDVPDALQMEAFFFGKEK